MTLTQLEYIVAVARHKSFSKAAEACHVSQPSLSIQIQKLEEELEVRIFERGPRLLSITDVGEAVIEQAERILAEAARLPDLCLSYRNEVRGLLRLGVIPTIGPFLLPHLLPRIRQQFPALRVEIFEDKTATLVADIERGQLDAAILSTPKKGPESLLERKLYYEPFGLFANTEHPLLRSDPLTIESLSDYSPALLDDTHCMRGQLEPICGHSLRQDAAITLKSGTLPTLMMLVDQQQSYTLLPYLAQEALSPEQRKAQWREFADPIPTRKISLVYHRHFLKRTLIEALIKALISKLPTGLLTQANRSKIRVMEPDGHHFMPHQRQNKTSDLP